MAKIPQATAKRLPLYYRFLNNLQHQGKSRVSSKELSAAVRVDSATIRRDFSYFGALGKKGYGYNVDYLLGFFRKTLDQDELTEVALIGVGNLGTAFLHYNFLKNNNTKIVMAFDTDPEKIGTDIGGTPIYHIDDLEEKLNDVRVAILTVPATEADAITGSRLLFKTLSIGKNRILSIIRPLHGKTSPQKFRFQLLGCGTYRLLFTIFFFKLQMQA